MNCESFLKNSSFSANPLKINDFDQPLFSQTTRTLAHRGRGHSKSQNPLWTWLGPPLSLPLAFLWVSWPAWEHINPLLHSHSQKGLCLGRKSNCWSLSPTLFSQTCVNAVKTIQFKQLKDEHYQNTRESIQMELRKL